MKILIFILALSASFAIFAEGDYQAGQSKVAVCAACHGEKGISVNPEWPSLAGQHARYLIEQLKAYKQGTTRQAAVMMPMVAHLTDQDMEDIAAYYAKQPLPENKTPKAHFERGQALYRGGDFDKHITACIACHGPDGRGNAQAGFPVLSGQHALYTQQQLQAFKDGKRTNDLFEIMRDISLRMDKDDMEAVAHYVAGLH